MENKLTPELIAKAKQAKSVEELLALAKENGIELNEDEAKEYFERMNKSGELSDDELDSVSGGGCGETNPPSLFDTLPTVNRVGTCELFKCALCKQKGLGKPTHLCYSTSTLETKNFCEYCGYSVRRDNIYKCTVHM